ncbi:MAG: FlgD immunoglobulin-like domain containing protein [Candidatus Cloacimonetes bacterium]|nr:FlgD immunoglobulin-like domain containing protein [Candidatus Cloacimonadota bacterium]
MRHLSLLLVCGCACLGILGAQTPLYEISVPPVFVTQSYYDYMIGGYHDLPLAEFSPGLGSGRVMTYHARRGSYSGLRKVYFSYVDAAGQLQTVVDPWQDVDVQMGYASLAWDQSTGKALYAWHESHDADTQLEVVFMHEHDPVSFPGIYSDRIPVFDPPSLPAGHENDEFVWPSIKTGPSPNPGMRRVYILGRNRLAAGGVGGNVSENVLIAYADFNAAMLDALQPLNWSYTTIPALDAWHAEADTVVRRMCGSFAVGDDGRIYYAGYHSSYYPDPYEDIDEPDLDVFVCDNYGAGTWQHYSHSSKIPSYNPWNSWLMRHAFYQGEPPNQTAVPDDEIYYSIGSSGHFNLLIDAGGVLHFPGLWFLTIGEDSYLNPDLFTVKEVVFDPDTQQFAIREVFPVAGTSSDDLWWMPWDTDGNLNYDNWPLSQEQPDMRFQFPFSHWDTEHMAGTMMMMFAYNYLRLTGGGADGSMACLWQDSYKARMYNLHPADSLQYAAYEDDPEIFLALSSDQGAHWSEPAVLSGVANPELAGMTPMWVYPSDALLPLATPGPTGDWKRLWLMFLDDHNWGAALPPSHEIDWGNVMYMALDLQFPTVSSPSEEIPPVAAPSLQAFPNPFAADCFLAVSLPAKSSAEITVYNLRGQALRHLHQGWLPAGEVRFSWDGRDDQGREVPSGLYLLRLDAGSLSATRRVARIK